MAESFDELLRPLIDEAVGRRLETLIDAKLRERLGEGAVILPLGMLADEIPELKEAQDEVLRIMRKRLAR